MGVHAGKQATVRVGNVNLQSERPRSWIKYPSVSCYLSHEGLVRVLIYSDAGWCARSYSADIRLWDINQHANRIRLSQLKKRMDGRYAARCNQRSNINEPRGDRSGERRTNLFIRLH